METWVIGDDGSVISPNGTRCAMVMNGCIYLYDKRIRTSVPFTLDDHLNLLGLTRTDLLTQTPESRASVPETSF